MIGCMNIWEEADNVMSQDTVVALSGAAKRRRLMRMLRKLTRGKSSACKSSRGRSEGSIPSLSHGIRDASSSTARKSRKGAHVHETMDDASTPPIAHSVPPPPRTTSPEGLTWSAHGATWFDLSVGFDSLEAQAIKGDVGLSLSEFDRAFNLPFGRGMRTCPVDPGIHKHLSDAEVRQWMLGSAAWMSGREGIKELDNQSEALYEAGERGYAATSDHEEYSAAHGEVEFGKGAATKAEQADFQAAGSSIAPELGSGEKATPTAGEWNASAPGNAGKDLSSPRMQSSPAKRRISSVLHHVLSWTSRKRSGKKSG